MNDRTEITSDFEHSVEGTAIGSRDSIYHSIFLPTKLYEALPAAYISVGALFVLGASYIGIGHLPMVGYLTVGVSCILAGLTVSIIRRRERSK